MSPAEIQKSIEKGNSGLVPYAMKGEDTTDNALLDEMLANAQVARRSNGTTRS